MAIISTYMYTCDVHIPGDSQSLFLGLTISYSFGTAVTKSSILSERLRLSLRIPEIYPLSGDLTGCGGAEPHNSPTSASSASLGHFSA